MNPYQNYGHQQAKPLDELKAFFNKKDVLSRLILINVLVFAAINLLALIQYIFNLDQEFIQTHGINRLTWWLSLPSDLVSLLSRPWSLITYMFVQEEVLHLFFNLLVLYVGGKIFNQFVGERKLLSVYILSGISGAVLYILTFNIFPAFQNVVGASFAIGSSASVLGIFIAAATYVPNLPMNVFLFGNVKLKYIALVFVALDLINIRTGNAGGHIAHLGGAIFGYLFIVNLRKNNDMSLYFNQIIHSMQKWFTKPTQTKKPFKKVYKNTGRPMKDEEYLKQKNEKQQEIDKILEKIKKSGYESLSAMEKQQLFDASKK